MTSSTNKKSFGIYDHGLSVIVIFASAGDPGNLPSYMDLNDPSTLVIDCHPDEWSWFELDTTKGIDRFEICRDLLLGGFHFDNSFSEKMARIYKKPDQTY